PEIPGNAGQNPDNGTMNPGNGNPPDSNVPDDGSGTEGQQTFDGLNLGGNGNQGAVEGTDGIIPPDGGEGVTDPNAAG
ncbi:hypothetical protein K0U00_38165, partial [Paenibacillus sepulcri]|nr:hypothetical protein [Paenibacillus sepulcri]